MLRIEKFRKLRRLRSQKSEVRSRKSEARCKKKDDQGRLGHLGDKS
ncbi:MAG: hypothetical protein ACOCWC_05550 [Bacteroidota bacterium]